VAAVARGARIIEKHLTLDKSLPGPDHKASLSPNELKMMVSQIREVEQALGSGHKYPFPIELENRIVARKSLTTCSTVRKGEIFTEENLTTKRPNTGISPFSYWDYLGRVATKDYNADEQLS
jgi:N-acetylneuraminate synthase